jgi:outer membrane protein assembly factor BamA
LSPRTSLLVAFLLAALPSGARAQVGIETEGQEGALADTIDIDEGHAPGAAVDLTQVASHEGQVVGVVEIVGRKVTREGVVIREIHTTAGQPLVAATVMGDVRRLQNRQIFSEVGVVIESRDDQRVRVRFVLKEMNAWLPTVATQYTEENGFSIGPGISALNLTGRNIRLTGSALFGGTTQFWSNFDWPWITGHHIGVRGRAALLDRTDTLNEFEEKSRELTLRPSRFLGKHGRLGAGLQLLTVASDRDGKTLSPTNEDLLVTLEASFGWDTRDSWNNPRRGWRNQVVISKTGGALGGDGDFWRLIVDLRRWQPTSAKQRLMLSGLMSLQSGEVGVDTPEYLQYRLGGANTIRGYDVERLGRVLYGLNQLLGTAEYSFRLVPMRRFDLWKLSFRLGLEVALFGDVGVAWTESRDLNSKRARAGGGAGLRLLVPGLEMARMDFGWSPEGGFRVHFAGGTKPERQRGRLR